MRIFLLPVSTRRSLLYAQRLDSSPQSSTSSTSGNPPRRSLVDRGTAFAARTWTRWEKQPSGWQRRVVDYGNQALRRIPFEEWGLKSVPPLSGRRREDEETGRVRVELVFPGGSFGPDEARALALRLATERLGLHRQRFFWCFAAMPLTLPFALVPIIPNIPFFYLVYRAWSHWRAIAGGRHLQWLVETKLLHSAPSAKLSQLYASSPPLSRQPEGDREALLLTQKQVRSFCEALDVPALEVELERAVSQVQKALDESRSGSGTQPEAGTVGSQESKTRNSSARRREENK
ncbi:protein (fungal and plant) [Ophiocordyceps camponoti-floridani]|uniref:Protein (Fungal and plant) n=1 Tax=Ophiocordyceps camponoti-floridani TaxID=2030778 RepID=A0A8H4QAX9_9HYPO|nr:protein (fungal and plant) [Ophiocordyceps camponoti-floridani]